MKKMKVVLFVVCSLLLTGCNKKESTQEQGTSTIESEKTSISSSSVSETTASKVDSSSQEKSPEVLWNPEKARELNQFVIDWGKTMKQIYREYTPDQNVDLYGLQLPKTVLTGEGGWQAVVDEVPIQLEWSEDGQGDGYALVAVFSDADTQPYLEKHVYFFTLVSGKPKVLVTSQNQGNEHNYLYFKETDNNVLKDGFVDLVRGDEVQ